MSSIIITLLINRTVSIPTTKFSGEKFDINGELQENSRVFNHRDYNVSVVLSCTVNVFMKLTKQIIFRNDQYLERMDLYQFKERHRRPQRHIHLPASFR